MERGWSRRTLAQAANVAPSTVTLVEEGGTQTPASVKALADALELNMADLIIEDEPEKATA